MRKKVRTLPDLNRKHCTEEDVSLNRRQQYVSKVLRHWWNRWKHEYLVDLRETHNLSPSHCGEPCIKERDIFTMHQEKMPREFWSLHRLKRLFKVRIKHP